MKQRILISVLSVVLSASAFSFPSWAESYPEQGDVPFVDGEVLVAFNDSMTVSEAEILTEGSIEAIVTPESAQTDELPSVSGNTVIEKGDIAVVDTCGSGVQESIFALTQDEDVAYVQPNYIYYVDEDIESIDSDSGDNSVIDLTEEAGGSVSDGPATNDEGNGEEPGEGDLEPAIGPEYYQSFDSKKNSWTFKYLNVPQAWALIDAMNLNRTNKVRVAVIDTGVMMNHPDMQLNVDRANSVQAVGGQVISDYRAVYEHGTKIASILCADSNNKLGIDGIASGNHNNLVSTACINVFPNTGRMGQFSATTVDIIAGLEQARGYDAKVINMAMGTLSKYLDYEGNPHDDVALKTEIDALTAENRIIVCSAGNLSSSEKVYPADFSNVISAISTKHYKNAWINIKMPTSNYGSTKTICAPGSSIQACTIGGYGSTGATSAASAHVSAVCALMLYVDPELSRAEAKRILCSTAVDVYKTGKDNMTASGMINAYNAVCETALQAAKKGRLTRDDGSKISVSQVNKLISSTMPSSLKVKKLIRPIVTITGKKGKSNTLKWKYKAPKYFNMIKIYRSTSKKGHYKCIKTITKKKTKKWIDKKIKRSKTYYYKIRVFGTTEDGKKITSYYSKPITLK